MVKIIIINYLINYLKIIRYLSIGSKFIITMLFISFLPESCYFVFNFTKKLIYDYFFSKNNKISKKLRYLFDYKGFFKIAILRIIFF